MQNPGSLAWFAEFAAQRKAAVGKPADSQAA